MGECSAWDHPIGYRTPIYRRDSLVSLGVQDLGPGACFATEGRNTDVPHRPLWCHT